LVVRAQRSEKKSEKGGSALIINVVCLWEVEDEKMEEGVVLAFDGKALESEARHRHVSGKVGRRRAHSALL